MKPLQNRRMLVVEDEYMLADDLRKALVAAGAEVIGPVSSEVRALELIALEEALDGAVLDMNLQGSSTTRVAERLADRQVPFVFATGYGSAVAADRFPDVPRWEKPYDATELVAALPDLIA